MAINFLTLYPINLITHPVYLPDLFFLYQFLEYVVQHTVYKLAALWRAVLLGDVYIFINGHLCWDSREIDEFAYTHPQ